MIAAVEAKSWRFGLWGNKLLAFVRNGAETFNRAPSQGERAGMDKQDFVVRTLCESDLSPATHLAQIEGWNQTREDWNTVLCNSPEHCFAAVHADELVGTVTTYRYSKTFAWIGMMVVRRDCRGRGIGRALMQTVVRSLLDAGCETTKLDATPMGLAMYEALGFEREAVVRRFELVAPDNGVCSRDEPPSPALFAELGLFDETCFLENRRPLLERLARIGRQAPMVVWGQNAGKVLRGYGFVRPGTRADYFGPIVAIDDMAFGEILDRLMAISAGRTIFIDVISGDAGRLDILKDRGFVKQRDLVRMRLGKKSQIALGRSLFASAGPELG